MISAKFQPGLIWKYIANKDVNGNQYTDTRLNFLQKNRLRFIRSNG